MWFFAFMWITVLILQHVLVEASLNTCVNSIELRDLSVEDRKALCKFSSDEGREVISCFTFLRGSFPQDTALRLCASSSQVGHVVSCVREYQYRWDAEKVVKLCNKAYSSHPMECAKQFENENLQMDQIARLCAATNPDKYRPGDTVQGVANCFWKAMHNGFTHEEAASICEQGNHLIFAECAITAKQNAFLKLPSIVAICAKSRDYPGAGPCAAECPKRSRYGTEEESCVAVCSTASEKGPGECLSSAYRKANMDKIMKEVEPTSLTATLATLCYLAQSDHPVNCLWKISPYDKITHFQQKVDLCANIKDSESIQERIRCFKTGPNTFPVETRIQLCNGTTSSFDVHNQLEGETGPAICARDVMRNRLDLSTNQILRLCRAHQSYSRSNKHGSGRAQCLTPIRSLPRSGLSQHSVDIFTDTAIEICRDFHEKPANMIEESTQIRCVLNAAQILTRYGKRFLEDRSMIPALAYMCKYAPDERGHECFQYMMKTAGLDVHQSSVLCSQNDVDPVASVCCVQELARSLTNSHLSSLKDRHDKPLVQLCRNVSIDSCSGPSECMHELKNVRGLTKEAEIALCINASSAYPVECAKRLRQEFGNAYQFADEALVDICTSANGNMRADPLQCMVAGKTMLNLGQFKGSSAAQFLMALCHGSPFGLEPVVCVREYLAANHRSRGNQNDDALFESMLVNLCRNAENGTETANCVSNAPDTLNVRNHFFRESLCGEQRKLGPAQCAMNLMDFFREEPQTLVDICAKKSGKDASACHIGLFREKLEAFPELCEYEHFDNPIGPVKCFQLLRFGHSSLTTEQMIDLCKRDAAGAIAKAECVMLAESRQCGDPQRQHTEQAIELKQEFLLDLCGNASVRDPGQCAKVVSDDLPEEMVVELCKFLRTEDSAVQPGQCLATSYSLGWDDRWLLAKLCSNPGEVADMPVKCASEAMKVGLVDIGKEHIAKLCQGATSPTAPIRCLSTLKQIASPFKLTEMVKLCQQRSEDILFGPEQCVLALQQQFSAMETDLLMRICGSEQIQHQGPIDCFRAAPVQWSNLQKIQLCLDALSSQPALCAGAASGLSSTDDVIQLCRGAKSESPAECASDLQALAPSRIRVLQCQGATTETPQQCFKYLLNTKYRGNLYRFPPSDIEYCKTVVAVPTRLAIHTMDALIGMLTNSQTLLSDINLGPFILEVNNQFEYPVSIAPSLKKVVLELRRANEDRKLSENLLGTTSIDIETVLSEGGLDDTLKFVFDPVQITNVFGDFELVFTSAGAGIKPITISVTIHRNLEEMMKHLYTCASIPSRLQCPAFQEEEGEDGLHVVPAPWSSILFSNTCERQLKAMGLTSSFTPIIPSLLFRSGVLVHIKNGPAKLLSGIGVPHEDMTPHEILQISVNASSSDVRRAYHKASLEWHPDRWATFHPDLQSQASKVFELVAQANLDLLEQIKEKKQPLDQE